MGMPLHESVKVVPLERENVYRNGIAARFHSVLGSMYPILWKNMDHDTLHVLSEEYVAAHPPETYNINDLGKNFPPFLKEHRVSRDFPFLASLAAYEWAIACSFHAEQQVPISLETFARLSEEELANKRFVLQDTLKLFDFEWNILGIAKDEEPRKEKTFVMIFRSGLSVYTDPLTEEGYLLLRALHSGKSLTESLDTIESLNVHPETVTQCFRSWVQKELFVRIQ